MTWQEFYLHWADWWFPITFVVSTLFILYYGLAAPWYKTPFGRALIAVDAGLAVSTFPEFVNILFHSHIYDNEAVAVFIMTVATGVPIAILYRIITLWRIRSNGMSKRAKLRKRADDAEKDIK